MTAHGSGSGDGSWPTWSPRAPPRPATWPTARCEASWPTASPSPDPASDGPAGRASAHPERQARREGPARSAPGARPAAEPPARHPDRTHAHRAGRRGAGPDGPGRHRYARQLLRPGRDSLQLTQFHFRIVTVFGIDLPIRQAYQAPDFAALAEAVDRARAVRRGALIREALRLAEAGRSRHDRHATRHRRHRAAARRTHAGPARLPVPRRRRHGDREPRLRHRRPARQGHRRRTRRTRLPRRAGAHRLPSGIEYVESFLGCLYAGSVAVPCDSGRGRAGRSGSPPSPPTPGPRSCSAGPRTRGRRRTAARRRRPRGSRRRRRRLDPGPGRPRRDRVPPVHLRLHPDPEGVRVTHANLLSNERAIQLACGNDRDATFVGWLPLFHDMGLIANLLQPLYLGSRSVLMPPGAFLREPLNWLRAIGTYRARVSGGPNFAYERACGASTRPPAPPSTCRPGPWPTTAPNPSATPRCAASARVSAPPGSRPPRTSLLRPRRGDADRDGDPFDQPPTAVRADPATSGRAGSPPWARTSPAPPWSPADSRSRGRRCASSTRTPEPPCRTGGSARSGCAARASPPGTTTGPARPRRPSAPASPTPTSPTATRAPTCAPATSGACWRAGCTSPGGTRTSSSSGARTTTRTTWSTRPNRRTRRCGPPAEPPSPWTSTAPSGSCCATNWPRPGRAGPRRNRRPGTAGGRRPARRRDPPRGLPAQGAVPKTTSGKVRRQRCRQSYADGELPVVGVVGTDRTEVPDLPGRAELDATAPGERTMVLATALAATAAALAGLAGTRHGRTSPGTPRAGLLRAMELRHRVRRRYGWTSAPPPSPTAPAPRPRRTRLGGGRRDRSGSGPGRGSGPGSGLAGGDGRDALTANDALTVNDALTASDALTANQEALWFEHELDPRGAAYHLSRVLRLDGPLDVPALDRALRTLTARHPALRTRFPVHDGLPRCHVEPDGPRLRVIEEDVEADIAGTSRGDGPGRASRGAAAGVGGAAVRPGRGPPFTATLLRRDDHTHLLVLVAHHLVADLWSFLVVLDELRARYLAETTGIPAELPRRRSPRGRSLRRATREPSPWPPPRTTPTPRRTRRTWRTGARRWRTHRRASPCPPTGRTRRNATSTARRRSSGCRDS
ncbi:condensation domain-containing protein [Streptomyces sp. M19]